VADADGPGSVLSLEEVQAPGSVEEAFTIVNSDSRTTQDAEKFVDCNSQLCGEFRPRGIVELYCSPEELSAVFCEAPASRARDLGHQMADV
jgi:hypothetical protein